jgi:hypothetical protein
MTSHMAHRTQTVFMRCGVQTLVTPPWVKSDPKNASIAS